MTGISVSVKWGKQEFSLTAEIGLGVAGLKAQLYQLTSVPADKQKLLGVPGGLKDDDMLDVKLKQGMKLTLLGTPESAQLHAPTESTRFVEDMSAEEISRALKQAKKEPLPVGIENLGNTCYMNAVVQVLFGLPKLGVALEKWSGIGASSADKLLTEKLRDLLKDLHGHSGQSVTPYGFLAALRARFPQFGQRSREGHYSQQDAEECFRGILEVLANTLKSSHDNAIDDLFGFDMRSNFEANEGTEESSTCENQRILLCHLGNQTEPVNHLHEGVKLSLKETIEKESTALGRTTQFTKTSAIASLPEYLVVQFARFQWKARSDSAGTEATRTKIVRKCGFQKSLDVYDFCTEDVKQSLAAGRAKKVDLQDIEDIKPDVNASMLPTGTYNLVGIVSHQGRSAEGGHYVGWTRWTKGARVNKKGAKEDVWLKFDDETVTEHELRAMIESGGICGGLADTQMAYFCVFEKEVLPDRLAPNETHN